MALILVVEDDDTTRFDVAETLTGWGHRVIEASNGRQGFEAIKRHRPDLVVSDIHMPDEFGFALVRRVAADETSHDGLAVIFISTTTDLNDIVHGMRCGANDYLPKPIDNEALKSKIEHYLGARSTSLRRPDPAYFLPHLRRPC